MHPAEPTLTALPHPGARYFLATRPAFLTITLVGCLLGLASALNSAVPFHATTAMVTILFALVAHAGVNVLNDFYDSRNGSDAANEMRLFPFTGGSRFIQNGVLTEQETGRFGYALLLAVIPAGLWLAAQAGFGLIWIGLAGLLAGWAYSAPPLNLMSRGVGELAVASGWALIVIGADYVQRQHFSFMPFAAGVPFALLVANLLFINQFPDRAADAQAGKRTLVVRLGPQRARWGYAVLSIMAYGWLLLMVACRVLPMAALSGLLTLPLNWLAARDLFVHAEQPSGLTHAIRRTIGAAHLHGLLVSAGLVMTLVSGSGI